MRALTIDDVWSNIGWENCECGHCFNREVNIHSRSPHTEVMDVYQAFIAHAVECPIDWIRQAAHDRLNAVMQEVEK